MAIVGSLESHQRLRLHGEAVGGCVTTFQTTWTTNKQEQSKLANPTVAGLQVAIGSHNPRALVAAEKSVASEERKRLQWRGVRESLLPQSLRADGPAGSSQGFRVSPARVTFRGAVGNSWSRGFHCLQNLLIGNTRFLLGAQGLNHPERETQPQNPGEN